MARGGDMLPRGELQHEQPFFTFDLKNPEPAISLLRQRILTGEPCPHRFVHEADPYSASPAELVRDRHHAPGKGEAWYMMSLTSYRQSVHGGSFPKQRGRHGSTANRQREVRGGDGEVCGLWRTEKQKEAVRDAAGRIVGYARTLYYWSKTGTTTEKIGWCMIECWLEQQDGADQQLVLCKVYRSNRKRYAQSSTAASSEAAPVDQRPLSYDDQVSSRVAAAEAVAEEPRDGGETLVAALPSIGNTATNLLLAAEKAVSCDFGKACEIDEFVLVKELHLTTIDELGLDRSILSGSIQQLELRLRHIAMEKELTPTARDRIVSCGESMSQIILSAYLNEVGKRARQAFNALERVGVNVHSQVSKRACKVTNVSLVVDDCEGNQYVRVLYSASPEDSGFVSKVEGEKSECPVPVISSVAASSSGGKRKADHVHPEAPPSLRQELADTSHPVPVEGDNVGDPNEPFMDILKDNLPIRVHNGDSARLSLGVPRMVEEYLQKPIGDDHGGFPRAEQQALLEAEMMMEGGSAPSRVLLETETGHQEMTDLNRTALKSRWRLCDNGGDSTGLFAVEYEVEDNSMPIDFNDEDQRWLSDLLMEDEDAEVRI